jgi:hypothetical protein
MMLMKAIIAYAGCVLIGGFVMLADDRLKFEPRRLLVIAIGPALLGLALATLLP